MADIPRGTLSDWERDGLDHTLPLDFTLDDKLVMEFGTATADNLSRYLRKFRCRAIGFEPVRKFYDKAVAFVASWPTAKILHCGVAAKTGQMVVGIGQRGDTGPFCPGPKETIEVLGVARIFAEYVTGKTAVGSVGLLTINCEGAEFEILDAMLDLDLQQRCENILIQFHRVIPDAEQRRAAIQTRLAKTHRCKFDYPFVWEAWERK